MYLSSFGCQSSGLPVCEFQQFPVMADQYRALTRTYRPHTFDDIVSQEHVSNTLKNAIKNNRISHAYMFCGPRGVGKTTMARVLARTINEIDASVDGESLNQTLNIIELDAASNNKVEDVHHLRESVRIPPQNGRYKIFIVDEVHMLSKSAFNALLKTLEEPPPHAIFIFATTEPHKVLPTILSRVQRFDFRRISVDEIVARLREIAEKESISIDDESLHIIAKKADGALRDALGLMDQAIAFCGSDIKYNELLNALNLVGTDQLFAFTEAIENRNADNGLDLIQNLISQGIDIQEFLVSLTEHFRNLYVALKSARMHLLEGTKETKQRYRKAAASFSEEDILRMLHLTSEAQIRIKDAQQPKTHFEILLLKLIHMHRSVELNRLISELEELKKNGWSEPSDDKKKEKQADESPKEINRPVRKQEKSQQNNGEEDSSPQNGIDNSNQGQHSKPSTGETETDAPASDSKDSPEEEDDDLFGTPTLGYSRNHQSQPETAATVVAEEPYNRADETSADAKVDIHKIRDVWPDVLSNLKENESEIFYLQAQRIEIERLKGNDLFVSAENEFVHKFVTENQRVLSKTLKKYISKSFKLKCSVRRKEKKAESLSPFEQFAELQKKDPKIRTIVELFGAELEY